MENNKGLVIGIVVIILLAVLFLLLGSSEAPQTGQEGDVVGEENVGEPSEVPGVVNEVDLNTASGDAVRLEGFPSDVPVETDNVLDSFSIDYDNGQREASIVYRSDASISELRDTYITYMQSAGYSVEQDDVTEQDALLFGSQGNSSLSVAIVQVEDEREVFVSVVTQ